MSISTRVLWFHGVDEGVSVGGKGVNVSVGVTMTGMRVSVGSAVGGKGVGLRVGEGVGVGRLRARLMRFSAWNSSPFSNVIRSETRSVLMPFRSQV